MMPNYTVTCETCHHWSTFRTHEMAIVRAESHAKAYPDHTVTVAQEPDEEENVPA